MASVLNVVTYAAPPLISLKPAYGPVKHVFLIGNCGYTHLPMLRLPIKDIEAIEEVGVWLCRQFLWFSSFCYFMVCVASMQC